jgi:hypothetical protein
MIVQILGRLPWVLVVLVLAQCMLNPAARRAFVLRSPQCFNPTSPLFRESVPPPLHTIQAGSPLNRANAYEVIMVRVFRSPSVARIAGTIATAAFLIAIGLQLLLALGVVPVTLAWGGTQSVLTPPFRLASVAAAFILGLAAVVIRRRAGLSAGTRPSRRITILAWIVTIFLALNTLGNFASSSRGEIILFGPLSLVLALACLLVAGSKLEELPGV